MNHVKLPLTAAILGIGIAMAGTVVAEESLLWKATSTHAAVSLPAYNGEESPFPKMVKKVEVNTDEVDNSKLREAALANAEHLVSSSNALVPYLDGIRVGGFVEGLQGRKVLVGNRWLGVGAAMPVRVMKSASVVEAIAALESYDAEAAQRLTGELNGKLAANPTLPLTLKEIREGELVFDSRAGRKSIMFNMKNN